MLEPALASVKELLAERALHLLKILVTTDFFGPCLPSVPEMIHSTRLPRNIIQDALDTLEKEGIVRLHDSAYQRVYPAHSLKKHRIGILTHTHILHNAYGVYQDFLIGLVAGLNRPDVQLSLADDLNSVDSKIVEVEEMLRSGVTAFILLGRAEKELRAKLVEQKVPTVICGNSSFDQDEIACVCNDNYGGMRSLVRHVVEQGHTEIGYYTTDVQAHHGFHRRLLGYREGLIKADLRPREEMVLRTPHSADSARWATEVYVSLSRRPTTIVCASDREAYELIAELQRSGIKVPNDVGVTGFDNQFFCAISDLSLTTMDIHAQQVGRIAGQHLLRELEHSQIPLHIMLPPSLIARSSVPLVK